jgi:hypothetical protein
MISCICRLYWPLIAPCDASLVGPDNGVGHPVQPLSEVRSPDAVCAKIRRRSGVTCVFQVCCHMVEPSESSSAGNLFTKDACRAALADEVEERRP